MAGGGVKGGVVYGETDEFSYNIIKDPVHIRDFQATLLHLFGIDHERFTYDLQGLNAKLTGVEPARVVTEIASSRGGSSVLIEFDNTQDDGNHIHSVWRDFDGDSGATCCASYVKTSAQVEHRRHSIVLGPASIQNNALLCRLESCNGWLLRRPGVVSIAEPAAVPPVGPRGGGSSGHGIPPHSLSARCRTPSVRPPHSPSRVVRRRPRVLCPHPGSQKRRRIEQDAPSPARRRARASWWCPRNRCPIVKRC